MFALVAALNFLHGGRRLAVEAKSLLRQPSDAQARVLDNLVLFLSLWGRPASPGELDKRSGRRGNKIWALLGPAKSHAGS